MPVPNLDRMSIPQLLAFEERHQHGRNYKELFGSPSGAAVRDTAWLACYAGARAGMKSCREHWKDEPQARVFEGLAANFLSKVTPAGRWRS